MSYTKNTEGSGKVKFRTPEEKVLFKHSIICRRKALAEEHERHTRALERISKEYREAKIKRPLEYAEKLRKENIFHGQMDLAIILIITYDAYEYAVKYSKSPEELERYFRRRLEDTYEAIRGEMKYYG